jgi:hypothetical protein
LINCHKDIKKKEWNDHHVDDGGGNHNQQPCPANVAPYANSQLPVPT